MIQSIALFLRFEYLIFALILPLLGSATVIGRPDSSQILFLLVSAFVFHIVISLENDIVDLPLDKTDGRRVNYPLVNGKASTRFAVFVVLLQIPILGYLIHLKGDGIGMLISGALVIVMMSIYNFWGKKYAYPLATDLAQGIGFGSMVLYGAASAGPLNIVSMTAFLGVINWMMFTNLVGGLRDLQNDFEFSAKTVPIFLGSKFRGKKALISKQTVTYGWVMTLSQFALNLVTTILVLGATSRAAYFILGEVFFLLVALRVLKLYFYIAQTEQKVEFDLGLLVMFLSATPLMGVFAFEGNPSMILATTVVGFVVVRKFLIYKSIEREFSGMQVIASAR